MPGFKASLIKAIQAFAFPYISAEIFLSSPPPALPFSSASHYLGRGSGTASASGMTFPSIPSPQTRQQTKQASSPACTASHSCSRNFPCNFSSSLCLCSIPEATQASRFARMLPPAACAAFQPPHGLQVRFSKDSSGPVR